MLLMAGGKPARGHGSVQSFIVDDPFVSLPLLEGPIIQVSEQGSSGEPHEVNDSDADEQPTGGHRSCRGGRHSSQSTYPTSQASGSKRKSTDESAGETSNKGQRYRENARKKKADNNRLADAGFELAKVMKGDVDHQVNRYSKKEEEITNCLSKMTEFGISGALQAHFIKDISKAGAFRRMFLGWTVDDVADYAAKNNFAFNYPDRSKSNRHGYTDHSTSNSQGYSPTFHHNFQTQGFPNHNQFFPNQHQGFPNQIQGENTFSYHPNQQNL